MKLFRFYNGQHATNAYRLLSICLSFCLFLGISVTVGATTAGSADLSSVTFPGVYVLDDFDPAETEYTLYIPQCYENGAAVTPQVPVATATPADPDANVSVVSPAEVGGDIVITVTPTGGGGAKVYTIATKLAGANLYKNGGFEERDTSGLYSFPHNPYYYCYGGGPMPTFLDKDVQNAPAHPDAFAEPYNGLNYVWTYDSAHWYAFYNDKPTLDTSKTYLYSQAVCVPPGSDSYTGGTRISNASDISYYVGAIKQTGLTFTVDDSWKKISAVFTPTSETDYSINYWLEPYWSRTLPRTFIDDVHVGELVIGSVDITNEYGEIPSIVLRPDEGDTETIQLQANYLNQLGDSSGLEGLTPDRWELKEAYSGVTLDQDGVLTLENTAPETIQLSAYTDVDFGTQTCVKGEITITLQDSIEERTCELLDIRVNGLSVPGFRPKRSNYLMTLPFSYAENQLTISNDLVVETVAKSDDVICTIDRPTSVNNGTLMVTATAEGESKIYQITLQTVGENKLTDGGFETGTSCVSGVGATFEQINTDVKAGSGALRVGPVGQTGYASWGFGGIPLESGKTYIQSVWGRLDELALDAYTLVNYNGGIKGEKRYFINDEEQKNNKVTFLNEWQKCQMLYQVTEDTNYAHYFVDSAWGQGNQPHLALDDYYLGELTVASIDYVGDLQLTIPETGTESYPFSATLKNQLGTNVGLDNETVSWEFMDSYPGVSIENGRLLVSEEATEKTILLRANVTPTFNNASYTISRAFEIQLVAESATPEIPRAYDVDAVGIVEVDEVLEGKYTYHSFINIPQGETTFRWLYADSPTGIRQPIPGAVSPTYTVESQYADKYIFFEVTPYTNLGRAGLPVVSHFLVKPMKPVVDAIKITNPGYVGGQAVASYRFTDLNRDEEGASTYRWLRSNSLNGTYTAISGARSKTYTITAEDVDCFLRFEVTPYAANDENPGNIAIGNTDTVVATTPTMSAVTIHKVDGTTYRVSYSYEHILGIDEGICKIQWYLDGSPAGTATSQKINDDTEELSVSVTPVAVKRPYEGVAVSTTLTVGKDNVVIGRVPGGGGGGFRVSEPLVPAPEIPEEPELPPEPARHWAADGIDFVLSRGIMQEPMPDDFCNSRQVTRAEFIYYVVKTIGIPDEPYGHEFADVSGEDYFAGALQAAVNKGIISHDVNFNPNRNVSRQEICKILVLAAELDATEASVLEMYVDGDAVSEWARGFVSSAIETGLLKGVSENEFSPLGVVTREQTAVMLKRLYDYKNGGAIS